MAIKPVRYACFLFRRRPRRDDSQVTVDLHGVRIDDYTAEPLRNLQRQRRLAAGSRPCNKHRFNGIVHRMTHIATIVGPSPLDPALVERLRGALPEAGEPVTLGPDAAD